MSDSTNWDCFRVDDQLLRLVHIEEFVERDIDGPCSNTGDRAVNGLNEVGGCGLGNAHADKEAYRASHVFRLRRLLSPAEWEPRASHVPGLIKVLLRSVEVQSGVHRTRWRGEADLCARRRAVAEQLESAEECTRVELEFHSQGRAYPCAVEILSPNRICLDQRAIGPMASSYLKARGLFVAA